MKVNKPNSKAHQTHKRAFKKKKTTFTGAEEHDTKNASLPWVFCFLCVPNTPVQHVITVHAKHHIPASRKQMRGGSVLRLMLKHAFNFITYIVHLSFTH